MTIKDFEEIRKVAQMYIDGWKIVAKIFTEIK